MTVNPMQTLMSAHWGLMCVIRTAPTLWAATLVDVQLATLSTVTASHVMVSWSQ